MPGQHWRGHHPPHHHSSSGISSPNAKRLLCFFIGAITALVLVSCLMSIAPVLHSRVDSSPSQGVAIREEQEFLREREDVSVPRLGQQSLPPEERGYVSRVELGEIARELATQGTVIMTVTNHGYQDFLENWMAFAEKVGVHRHLLIVAEDAESWDHAQRLWPGQAVRIHVSELEDADEETQRALGLAGAGSSGGGASEFNSPRFKKMMYRRVFYVRELLYAKVSVLLTDTDIVFLRNPLPIIHSARAPQLPGVSTSDGEPVPFDFLGMLDEPDEQGFHRLKPYPVSKNASLQYLTKSNFCGGFLFFRCSPAAWVMVDLLAMKLFRAAKTTGKENEQTFLALVMWEALRLQPPARVGILPQQLFVPGWLYFQDNKYQWWRQRFRRDPKNKPVIVHNNWVMGREAKIKRFIAKNMWALPHLNSVNVTGKGIH